MSKLSIVPKTLPSKFSSRDNINDYILRIEERGHVVEVTQFEWHSAGTYDATGKYHCIHGLKVPVRYVWDAIDSFGRPDKAICTDGTTFWIMNSYYDRDTGKCIKLTAGNSSPFDVIARDTPISHP